LLGGVVLASAEDVGFGAFGVAELVDLGLKPVSPVSEPLKILELTIVPKVISPTKAYGGSKLKLIMMESLSAFKLSSS
jgi:hypothetical protein